MKLNNKFLGVSMRDEFIEAILKGMEQEQSDPIYIDTDAIKIIVYDMTEYTGSVDALVQDLHIGHQGARYKTKFENVMSLKELTQGVSKLNNQVFNVIYNADGQDSVTMQSKGNVHEATRTNQSALETLRKGLSPIKSTVRTNAAANHEERIFNEVGIELQQELGLPNELFAPAQTLMVCKYKNTTVKIFVIHRFSYYAMEAAKKLGADVMYSAHDHRPKFVTSRYTWINPDTRQDEEKTLRVIVGASAIKHAAYHAKNGGQPANTTDLTSELVETKQPNGTIAMRQNVLNVDALIAVSKMLKPSQIERVDNIHKKNVETVKKEILNISKHNPKQAVVEAYLLEADLRNQLKKLEDKYEKQLILENKQIEKPTHSHTKKQQTLKEANETKVAPMDSEQNL